MVVKGTEMVRSLGGRINRGSSEEEGDGDGGEQRRMRRSSRKKGNTREKREKIWEICGWKRERSDEWLTMKDWYSLWVWMVMGGG